MYTNVPKPTGSSYTNINAAKPSYDEPSLSYDDPSTYYDGSNTAAYTNISKPVGSSYTNVLKPV